MIKTYEHILNISGSLYRNVGRVFTREPEAVIDGPLSRSQSGAGRMAQNKGARGGSGGCDCWGLRSKGVCVCLA